MPATNIGLLGRVTLLASGIPAILGLFALGPILPSIARAFPGLAHVELLSQLVGGLVGLAFAVASPIMGVLVKRFGYRAVYFWSTLVFSLSGLSVMFLDNLYLILFTRLVLGAAVAGALVAAVTGMSTLPQDQRARLFGLQTMVGGGLGLIGYIAVAKIAEAGWRAPFALHALGLLMLPFILMLPKGDAPADAAGLHAHGAMQVGGLARGGIAALGGLTLPFVLLAIFSGMSSLIPPLFSPFYLTSIGVTDPKVIALPLMAAAAGAIVAAYFYDRLQRRVGINGVYAALLLLIALGAGLSGLTANLWQFTAAQIVMSAGLAWTIANLNAAAVLVARPGMTSRAIAVGNGLYYGAQSILPFVASGLRQLAGPSGVFEGFALVGLIAGIIYVIITVRERRHPRGSEIQVEAAVGDALS